MSDSLEERALRARASLNRATSARPVPVLHTTREPAAHRIPRWAAPAVAALAVVAVVLGSTWGGGQAPHEAVVPGAVTSVRAGELPVAVATDGRLVWVADAGRGQVLAFDAHTLRQRWSVPVGSRPVALAVGLGAVWVVDAEGTRLLALDPDTGATRRSGRTSLDPVAVEVAFGAVWVLSAGNQTLDRYDPGTVTQSASAVLGAAGRAVTHSRTALWVSSPTGLLRVDPAALAVRRFAVGGEPRQVVSAGGTSVWVARADQTLVLVDGASGVVVGKPTAFSAPLSSLAASGSTALAATTDGQVRRYSQVGESGRLVAAPGSPVEALAAAGRLVVGTARSTALLYATEDSP